jgi:hypothetical protein
VGGSTVSRTKRYFVLGNLEAALQRRAAPRASRKLSGKEKTLLIATTCSRLPAGHSRRALELLFLSRETVRRRLAENDLSRAQGDVVHSAGRWRIRRPDGGHARSRSKTPVVCFDESPTQLFGEVRLPIPAYPCLSLPIPAYPCLSLPIPAKPGQIEPHPITSDSRLGQAALFPQQRGRDL